MKCQQGDMAKIIYSLRPENVGKIVIVKEYIGRFSSGEVFDYRGVPCQAHVPDHYWWVSAPHGLSNLYGETSQAYIADTWLEPLRPEEEKEKSKEEKELDILA
ncbi:hypothetical protein N9A25_00255 [bacterium]|nr:hypothetical protein [bacterium]